MQKSAKRCNSHHAAFRQKQPKRKKEIIENAAAVKTLSKASDLSPP
jgi:hypothetical protein